MRFLSLLRRFGRAHHGATSVEYALLIGLVALVAVVAWAALGDGLKTIIEYITTNLA